LFKYSMCAPKWTVKARVATGISLFKPEVDGISDGVRKHQNANRTYVPHNDFIGESFRTSHRRSLSNDSLARCCFRMPVGKIVGLLTTASRSLDHPRDLAQ
jgi:hypothetical protein